MKFDKIKIDASNINDLDIEVAIQLVSREHTQKPGNFISQVNNIIDHLTDKGRPIEHKRYELYAYYLIVLCREQDAERVTGKKKFAFSAARKSVAEFEAWHYSRNYVAVRPWNGHLVKGPSRLPKSSQDGPN